MKALVAVKTKLFKPCKIKLSKLFKFKLRKPVFISALGFRPRSWHNKPRKSPPRNRMAALLSGFRTLKKSTKMDSHSQSHRSVTEGGIGSSSKREIIPAGDEDVEDACRSFENYLVEMIVEEGKVGDLTDVEELLYCWKNLKSPVFIYLVCRFYGELCKDLFSPDQDDHTLIDHHSSK
ncbi:transcription repressor OFP17-like [Pistacia vera]|uniref:transcription repressor OFP17-like n=1 Tax=Pistacia vera TaxID=55513 RepID=UPI0012633F38|nr:transcription repressor OFP17-like [Pistacia vera]